MNILRKYKISKILNTPLSDKEMVIIDFMEKIFSDITIYIHPFYNHSYFYMNSNGDCIFEYETVLKSFRVNYTKVWSYLLNTYKIEDKYIPDFIQYLFEERFKHKIPTPIESTVVYWYTVEEDFRKQVIYDYKKFIMKDFNI